MTDSTLPYKAQDLLIEIGTEELPPKALRSLRKAFSDSICSELSKRNIPFGESVKELAAPRRLAVLITDVAEQQPDQKVEMLGPAVKAAFDAEGKPTGAATGFSRKTGVEIAGLQQVETPKGPRLAHISTIAGKATDTLIAEIITTALNALPIPKRMRWGSSRAEFVRPVHWIVALLGNKTIDAEVLGIKAGNSSRGHRFHANKDILITEPSQYIDLLKNEGWVQVDYLERMESIRTVVTELAKTQLSGTAVIDERLLEEVCSLVEWPVPLAGKFEERFLSVPSEALISSMKEHQKYFHVVDSNDKLMPYFITVSNIESSEPARVIDGNERVIRPRLSDAAFFYETDKKTHFEDFRSRLKPIVFQVKLGSIYDKTERVAALSESIASITKAIPNDAKRAGELCKCDLVSDMVLEFDDLQGIMGRYYAAASGENDEVSAAMFEHYLPSFAGDKLPETATGSAVALADRLDTLTGIFGIGQLPSGSKDPFALRRASLGILRLLVENNYQASLSQLIDSALELHTGITKDKVKTRILLLDYLLDRFAAWYSDMNIATECFLAVRALKLDNPTDINARVLAVSAFSKTENASALAAANKRVANILSKATKEGADLNVVDSAIFEQEEETALFNAITAVQTKTAPMIENANYADALSELALLRNTVDSFFDKVMVMADNDAIRQNRLALLQQLRSLFLSIADISLLSSGE